MPCLPWAPQKKGGSMSKETVEKNLQNLFGQLELLNGVVALLLEKGLITPDEVAKVSPFGYDETKVKCEQLIEFIKAVKSTFQDINRKK